MGTLPDSLHPETAGRPWFRDDFPLLFDAAQANPFQKPKLPGKLCPYPLFALLVTLSPVPLTSWEDFRRADTMAVSVSWVATRSS